MELLNVALKFFDYNVLPCLRWFTQPAIAFGSTTPASLIHSDEGRTRTLRLLQQLEFGVLP
nr:antitoxin Xre/MbcA/ParS toxin-binding domain-containing protein [Pseudomonas insulae]